MVEKAEAYALLASCRVLFSLYEGHSESYLPDHLIMTLAFCFWQCIIDQMKYITAAEYQLAQCFVACYVMLVVHLICLLLWMDLLKLEQ